MTTIEGKVLEPALKSAEVFALLAKLTEFGEGGEPDTTKDVPTPPRSWMHPWEPEYVNGYTFADGLTMDDLYDAYVGGENILLVGPSGNGKSTIAFSIVDKANEKVLASNCKKYAESRALVASGKAPIPLSEYKKPLIAVPYSCHEGMRSEELIGTMSIKIDEKGNRLPIEVDGAAVLAWEKGGTLIIDETDLGAPGVWGQCHVLLDGRTYETTIYINGPRLIVKDPRFRCLGTMNTKGQGENALEYAGTQALNAAFLSRFNFFVEVGWLDADVESALVIKRTGIPKEILSKMMGIVERTRSEYASGNITQPISTRTLLAWARIAVRRIKRGGGTVSSAEGWRIACTSALPAFTARIADVTTRDMYRSLFRVV